MAKKAKQPTVEDFLNEHDTTNKNYEEVDTLNLERDTLYELTINDHHTFDGKFGPATVINYTNGAGETYKAYLGGFEVSHFNKFADGKELPFTCQMVRTQKQSEQNEDRKFNRLVIAEA
jgi:hypothetical protein